MKTNLDVINIDEMICILSGKTCSECESFDPFNGMVYFEVERKDLGLCKVCGFTNASNTICKHFSARDQLHLLQTETSETVL